MNNIKKRGRGRPRQFDVDEVLDRAQRLFWVRGLSGTSLDNLAAAMDMNRPSLQNAFGNKEAIYRLVLERFVGRMRAEVGTLLFDEPDLRTALRNFYDSAIKVYLASEPALGCLVMCTAPLEASTHPEVQRELRRIISELDGILLARFRQAIAEAQLPPTADCAMAAKVTQGILHSVALRARAGEPRASLRKMAHRAVDMICANSFD